MATLTCVRALAPRGAPAARGLPRRARAPKTSFPPKRTERTRSPALRAVFDPNQASHEHGQYKYDQATAHDQQQATNVYHEPVGASPNQAHGSFSNPGEPDYLPHLASTRQRFIDQEASAVRVRDYPVAARSARILQRLVEIERDLMLHETAEMEASLAQEYQTANVAKRKKDALLEEFYDLRFDKYDVAQYDDVQGFSGQTRGGDAGDVGVALRNNSVSSGGGGRDASADAGRGGSSAASEKRVAPALVPVRFSVNVQPQFGEGVVVCGDLPELGAWDGALGVPMEYRVETKTWSCTVGLPQSSQFKFKFVVTGGRSPEEEARGEPRALFWQEGDDRAVALPFEDALSLDVVVDWEGDAEQERMWLCMPVPRAAPEAK